MTDRLEQFIREQRAEFDIETPDPGIWRAIEKDIAVKKSRPWVRTLSIAASVCILVVAAYFMGTGSVTQDINANHFANESQFEEFQEAEQFYVNQINSMTSQVEQLEPGEDVMSDLQQLDEVYNELKEEILRANLDDNESLISLMIQNYQTKIEILERILSKSKDQQKLKLDNDETINI